MYATPEEQLTKWLKDLNRPITYAAIAAQAEALGADIDHAHIQWIWPADGALWGWSHKDQPKEHKRWGFVL